MATSIFDPLAAMRANDGIPGGALPLSSSSSNNGIPAITFTPGIANQTEQQKAAEYNRLFGQGFTDAQIRSAANTTFGTQSDTDWGYLTNLAGQAAQPTYFQQNPDVAAAYANRFSDPNLASTVNMTPDQFAAAHFQNFGASEQRAAPVGALAFSPTSAEIANTSGLGSQGIGVNTNSGITVTDEVANAFKTTFGRDPTASELDSLRNTYGMSLEPGELARIIYDRRDAVAGYGLGEDQEAFNYSGGVVDKLTQQILGQNLTQYWSGEGYGSAQKNASDMAVMLAAAGITDINQFGKVNVAADASVTPVYEQKLMTDPEYGEYMGNVIVGYKDANGNAVDPSIVKTAYDEYSGTTDYLAPVGTKQVFGNKATGTALDAHYSKANDNIFSGTFAGKGSTGYGVQFKSDGSPVFYTQYMGSSNDLAQLLEDPLIGSIVQIAASYFGGPLGTAALNLAAGREPEDVAKAALTSWVAGEVGKVVAGAPSVVDALGQTGANIAGRVAGSVATGGGEEGALQSLITGGINAAMPEIQSMIPGYSNLPPFAKTFVNNAIVSTLQDGNLSQQDLINAAVRAGTAAVRSSNTRGGGALSSVADAEDAIDLPPGIQTASTEGGLPTRIEVTGAPIFADSGRANSVSAPPGYTLASTTDAVMNEPARYDDNDRLLPKSDGTYYDITQNAWFKPTGEFEAATNVQDYSHLFDGSQTDLTDADVAAIRGGDAGLGTGADFDYSDMLSTIGNTPTSGALPIDLNVAGDRSNATDLGTLDIVGNRPPADDLGEVVITDTRPPADDLGEIEIVGNRPPADDLGEVVITDTRPPVDDLGEIVITDTRPPVDDLGEVVITDTRPPPDDTTTTTTTTTTTPPTTVTTTPTQPPGALLAYAAPNSAGGALPGNLTGTMLAAGQRSEIKIMQDLQQLYPQIANIDPQLLSILAGRSAPQSRVAAQKPEPATQAPAEDKTKAEKPTSALARAVPTGSDALMSAGLKMLNSGTLAGFAKGGTTSGALPISEHVPEFITGKTGNYVQGAGDGQSDDIPAMLADGEYVFDADIVSALGNGSNKAGAEILDKMREEIRKHKRSAPPGKIPPPAKSPLEYMKG